MDQSHKEKIFAELNRMLLENELSVENRETLLEAVMMNHLDHMEDIEEIDIFQDRVNDLIDDYVEQHFEDTMEDNYN